MWKYGFFLFVLFLLFPAQAVPDSLLYPKVQLDAFKGRVAVARKYADTATMLFKSVVEAPEVSVRNSSVEMPAIQVDLQVRTENEK